jgi:phosphatidyl-myo-inositol dimannoside synthase
MGSTRSSEPRGARRGATDERPRLLLLTPDYPPAPGGIQVVAERLAQGLQGVATTVIAPDGDGAASFDAQSGVRTHRVRGGARVRGGRNALLNAAALARGLALRPQMTLSMHTVTSPAAAAIRRGTGAATVQYFHAEEIGAKPRLAAFAADHADACIAVSDYTAGLVAAAGGDVRALHVIGNGTDLPEDADLPEDPAEPEDAAGSERVAEPAEAGADATDAAKSTERPTILTIARIEERYKGHDTMVRALPLVLAKVPRAQWVVIGDGSLREGLEALARSYDVAEAIRFLGAVSEEQRNMWLRRAALLAMPSRLPAGGLAGEGFGIVYLEAGAYGKPVVAGNVGGALDAVRDGETGLLVDPTDPLLVAEAIARLLLDPELARRLGEAGRRHAQAHSWPRVIARVEALLLEQLRR